MSDYNFLNATLGQLAIQSPVLVVYIIGLVFSLMCLHRYPKPALLTLIATALLLCISVLTPFASYYLVMVHSSNGASLGWLFSGFHFTISLFRALGIGLFLAAAFSGRNNKLSYEN
jgi:hypothetical protein